MAEQIGVAYIGVEVDADAMTGGLSRAKAQITGLTTTSEQQFAKVDAATKRAAVGLAKYAQNMGKATHESKALSAAQRIGGALGDQLAAAIMGQASAAEQAAEAMRRLSVMNQAVAANASAAARASEQITQRLLAERAATASVADARKMAVASLASANASAAQAANARMTQALQSERLAASETRLAHAASGTSKSFSGSSKSARELQFATRGLPAQFTDIATSLAAGQSPMMVFLQQGGQIKDTFGGAGSALRAMGGYVAGLINPLTVGAAILGTLGAATYKGAQEFNAYNVALAKTGDFAGYTAAELAAFAGELDNIKGITEGGAAEAIAKVAATGKLSGENFKLATNAALVWSEATGESIDTVIDKFVEIGKDPVDALLKLNKTEHFLTQTQIDRIRTLEEEGRAQEAVAEASRIYSENVIEDAKNVEQNLGFLERAWKSVGNQAAEAWDAMLALGRKNIRPADELRAEIEQLGDITFDEWRKQKLRLRQASLDPKDAMLLPAIDEAAFRREIAGRRKALTSAIQSAPDFIKIIDGSEPVVRTAEEEARQSLREQWASDDEVRRNTAQQLQHDLNEAEAEGIRLGLKRAEIDQQLADIRLKAAEDAGSGGRGRRPRAERAPDTEWKNLPDYSRWMQQAMESTPVLKEIDKAQRGAAEAADRHRESIELLIFDMEEEARISLLHGVEKEKAIALRYANVDAASAEGQAITDAAERLYQAREVEAVISDVNGAMVDFAVTAASNFGSAGDAFEDFTDRMKRLAIQLLAEKAIQALAGMFMGQSNYNFAGDADYQAALAGPVPNAKGGVYNSASLSAYSGQVVDRPTMFAFAKGAGLMGEAGPEAIMPLSRGPDGKLGVRAEGGGVTVQVINNSGGQARTERSSDSNGGDIIKVIIDQAVSKVNENIMKQGGSTNKAISQTFGLQRRGVLVSG